MIAGVPGFSKLSLAEAADRQPDFFDQAAIIGRTKHLPAHKAWRFLPGAMQKWGRTRDLEDRQLNATGYLARVVRAYAEALFLKTEDQGKRRSHVWVLPGRMTAMLRHRWGLNLGDHNRKSRNDHRHHAIDAAVVGVIDRRMAQVLQTHARNLGMERLDRVLRAPPEPFEGFRVAALATVEKVKISHRAQYGNIDPTAPSQTRGRLHEDTVFGLVRDVPENQADRTIGDVVVRKPVTGLTEKEIGQVRDVKLRLGPEKATRSARNESLPGSDRKKRLSKALAKWVQDTGHRKLRILKPKAGVRPVCDRDGKPYKWLVPGEITFLDILEAPGGIWFHHATDIWAANSGGATPWNAAHPEARFSCAVRMEPCANRVRLVGVNEAGVFDDRHKNADDPFRWDLATIRKNKLRRARRVRFNKLGRVHPIPHERVQQLG